MFKKKGDKPKALKKRRKIPSKMAGVFQDLISYNTLAAMKKADGEELSASEFETLFPYLAEFIREHKDLV